MVVYIFIITCFDEISMKINGPEFIHDLQSLLGSTVLCFHDQRFNCVVKNRGFSEKTFHEENGYSFYVLGKTKRRKLTYKNRKI